MPVNILENIPSSILISLLFKYELKSLIEKLKGFNLLEFGGYT